MENIIRNYFQAWIDKNIEPVREAFSDDIIYTESYGPEYNGIEQVLKWFTDWNRKGTVLAWDIRQITIVDRTAFVECIQASIPSTRALRRRQHRSQGGIGSQGDGLG